MVFNSTSYFSFSASSSRSVLPQCQAQQGAVVDRGGMREEGREEGREGEFCVCIKKKRQV